MNIYDVIQRSDGSKVTSYSNPTEIVDGPYPTDEYAHILRVKVEDERPAVTVYKGKRRLTKLEFRALLTASEQQSIDEFEVQFESLVFPADIKKRIRTSIRKREEATLIDLDEPDITLGLGLYVALGKLAFSRISEILNG